MTKELFSKRLFCALAIALSRAHMATSNANATACVGQYQSCTPTSTCCANLTCQKFNPYMPSGLCQSAGAGGPPAGGGGPPAGAGGPPGGSSPPGGAGTPPPGGAPAPGGSAPAPGGGAPAPGGSSPGASSCVALNQPCGQPCCANLTCNKTSFADRGTCVPKDSCSAINQSCGSYGVSGLPGGGAGSFPCCANLTCTKAYAWVPGKCQPAAPAGQKPAADGTAGRPPVSAGQSLAAVGNARSSNATATTTAACAGQYQTCTPTSTCCANLTCQKYSPYMPSGLCQSAGAGGPPAAGGGPPAGSSPGGGPPAGQALASSMPGRMVPQSPVVMGLALAATAVAALATLVPSCRSLRGRTGMEEPLMPA